MRKFKGLTRRYVASHKSDKKKNLGHLKNHPFVVPVITFLVLVLVTGVAFIGFGSKTYQASDARTVIVSYDNKVQTIPTRAPNVGELLKRLQIDVHEGDRVEPALDETIAEDNFRINIHRARPITIVDGNRTTTTFNAGPTPISKLTQAGVTVYPEDKITVGPPEDVLKDGIGEKVVIDRATPAHLNLYGTPTAIRTRAKTVGELLKEKNIQVGEQDVVVPAANTPLAPNTQIFVARLGTQITTTEEAISAPQETVQDDSLSFGTTVVRQAGSPGKKLITYQLELQNGKEVKRTKIQEIVVQEPVKKIVARGRAVAIPEDKTSIMSAAGVSPSDYAYVNYIISRESGWCHTKWQGQVGYCPAYYEERYSPSSGRGYGLCQSTPAIKMATAGADWATNPVTQLRWCHGYAQKRHGGWAGAYNYWLTNHNW